MPLSLVGRSLSLATSVGDLTSHCRQVKAAIFLGTGQPNCLRNQAACVHACEQDVEKLSFSTVTARCSKPNAGYHAYAFVSNHCAMQQALLFSLQPSPAHRRPSRELLAQPPRCVHFGVICSAFTSPSQSRRPRTKVDAKADYRGSRWQPNKPRPPQFCRGVSCICTVSAGPPELLGRKALTIMGICMAVSFIMFLVPRLAYGSFAGLQCRQQHRPRPLTPSFCDTASATRPSRS